MPVVEHGPRRAVGVVAQDRHLVEEDLSPRLEIVVVQEETQERAVAGGALRIPKDNRVLRSSGLGIRTGSRNAKKTDSNRRRQTIEGGWQKGIGNVDHGWRSFGWRQDSECKSGAGLWRCEVIVTSNKNQMANYAHHQAIRGKKTRRPMYALQKQFWHLTVHQAACDRQQEKLEWDLVQNLAFTGCRNTQNFFRDRLQRGELVEGSHFCVDPLMCTNLPWFSLVHGARTHYGYLGGWQQWKTVWRLSAHRFSLPFRFFETFRKPASGSSHQSEVRIGPIASHSNYWLTSAQLSIPARSQMREN
ncbi:hypothetical protein B0H14DRAFT_2559416 [Mycena olivaceomarginata]|nr:hypothetical protein B0H14DRAFT_2559416 [Mycena olivaceomarginata]